MENNPVWHVVEIPYGVPDGIYEMIQVKVPCFGERCKYCNVFPHQQEKMASGIITYTEAADYIPNTEEGIHRDYDLGEDVLCLGAECPYCGVKKKIDPRRDHFYPGVGWKIKKTATEPIPACGGWDIEGPDHPPPLIHDLERHEEEIFQREKKAGHAMRVPKEPQPSHETLFQSVVREAHEIKRQAQSEPKPPSVEWYCNLIQKWADKEKAAIRQKLDGYCVLEDDFLAIIRDGAGRSNMYDTEWNAMGLEDALETVFTWWRRHDGSAERAAEIGDLRVLRRSMADLLGYVFTILAICEIYDKTS